MRSSTDWVRLVHVGAVLLAVALSNPRPAAAQGPLRDLDAYIRRTMPQWEIPGLAVAVVKDDSVVFMRGYGVRELGQAAAVTEETLFQIGSTTKAFTAAALEILADEDKLDWDIPIVEYMPWFQLKDPWVTRNVTARDLLTHRVGIEGSIGVLTLFDRREVIQRLRYLEPGARFRTRYLYSNLMYATAGQLVAEITGSSWDDFVRRRLLEPLGMTSTHTTPFDVFDPEFVAACFLCDIESPEFGIVHARPGFNVAMPHMRQEGVVRPIPWSSYDNAGSAGSIVSNVRDMAKWVQFQLNNGILDGQRVISEDQVEEGRRPQLVVRPEGTWKLVTDLSPTTHFSAYGFGWRLNDFHGRKLVWHTGGIFGFLGYVALLPEEHLGIVVLSNLGSWRRSMAILPFALSFRLFESYLGVPPNDWSAELLPRAKAEVERLATLEAQDWEHRIHGTQPSLPLDAYVGEYADSALGVVRITEADGTLEFRIPNAFGGPIEHWHHDVFRLTWSGPTGIKTFVTFLVDPSGKIETMDAQFLGRFSRIQ